MIVSGSWGGGGCCGVIAVITSAGGWPAKSACSFVDWYRINWWIVARVAVTMLRGLRAMVVGDLGRGNVVRSVSAVGPWSFVGDVGVFSLDSVAPARFLCSRLLFCRVVCRAMA